MDEEKGDNSFSLPQEIDNEVDDDKNEQEIDDGFED